MHEASAAVHVGCGGSSTMDHINMFAGAKVQAMGGRDMRKVVTEVSTGNLPAW